MKICNLLSLLSHLLSLLKRLIMWCLTPLVIDVIEEFENLEYVRVLAYARENGYSYGMWIVVVNV